MATFRFRVTIQGDGKDETEAWNNAVEAFNADPGVPGDEPGDIVVVENEDEDDVQEIEYPNT